MKNKYWRGLSVCVFVWLVVLVLVFVVKDQSLNEDDFVTKRASVISASCNKSRSFLGVDVQLKYDGEKYVSSETLQIIENLSCDDKLLNLLRSQGVRVTRYLNWQIEIVTGNIALISRERGVSRASDHSSIRNFLILIGAITTFFSLLYMKKARN